MDDLILLSKCSIPVMGGCIIDRLLINQRLDKGLEFGYNATIVSAPPGYGKTLSVLSWLKQRALPCAWLTLDESDNDLTRFHVDFTTAMRNGVPAYGKLQPEETIMGVYNGPDWTVRILLYEISLLEHNTVMVLDDLQMIKSQEVFQLLYRIIDSKPEKLHLILLTREDPPLPIARWRANRKIMEFRENDLRFGLNEVKEFFSGMGEKLSEDEAGILLDRTEGWAVGLYLSELALQNMSLQRRIDFATAFYGTQRFIIDYLIEEVLANIDEGLKQFLYRTSIANRFCGEMCNVLTGRNDSERILLALEKQNLYIFPLDETRQWYRYHSLFGEILQSGLTSSEKVELHQKAAHWLEENGYSEEAARHASEAGEYRYLAELLSQIVPGLIQNGEIKSLMYRLKELPEYIFQDYPHLIIAYSWCYMMTGKARKAIDLIEQIDPEWLTGIPNNYIALLNVLLLYLQISCNSDIVNNLGKTIGTLLKEREGLRAYNLHTVAQKLLIQENIDEASRQFMEAYSIARADGQHYIALLSAKDAAMNLLILGKKKECDRFCNQVMVHYGIRNKRVHPLAMMMYLPMAASCYVGGDLHAALAYIEEGLSVYRQMSLVYMVLQAELQLSIIQQGLGHTEEALGTIKDAIDSLNELDFRQARGFMMAIEANFMLSAGRKDRAKHWAEENSFSIQTINVHINERQLIIYARILLAENKLDDACKLLNRLEKALEEGHRSYRLVTVYILQAILNERLNHMKKSKERIIKALDIAEKEDLFQLFIDDGPEAIGLIRRVLPQRQVFIQKLLELASKGIEQKEMKAPCNTIPESVNHTDLIEKLSDREIEVLRLAAEGCSNEDIARTLYITLGTVKWHMNNILSKTGTKRRTQAIACAKKQNLI